MQRKPAHLIQRYNTAAVWTSNNPVLLNGELGIESDTGKVKLGNGTATWTALDYFITNESQIDYIAGPGTILNPATNVLSADLLYDIINIEGPWAWTVGTMLYIQRAQSGAQTTTNLEIR